MSDAQAIAAAFTDARREGRALDAFPIQQPAALADAYAVQEQAIGGLGGPLAGWKIAAIRPDLRTEFGADRWIGPIVRLIDARQVPDQPTFVAMIKGGFCAVEAEFAILIGTDLPVRSSPYSLQELSASVAALHVACEVAGSPLASLSELGPTAVIADHGNNLAIVIGPALHGRSLLAPEALTARTMIDGVVVGDGNAARLEGGPLGALAFLVDQLATRGRHLRRGDWVSTGATTGVHRVVEGAMVDLEFCNEFRLSVRIRI